MSDRLLIMAGGTGGHVFPALAVAQDLRDQGWDIHWLGTRGRLEEKIVPANAIPIHYIDVKGVRGNGLVRKLAAPFKIAVAVWQAYKIITQLQPDVVLGMGGYASGPGGVATRLRNLPLVLHEQNAAPGLTNRLLSKIAQKVITAFNGTFPGKEVVLGNPLRQEILNVPLPEPRMKNRNSSLNLLVVGGSLGAQVLNQTVPEALSSISSDWNVRHQTGAGRQSEVEKRYAEQNGGGKVMVLEFIDDMAGALAWADLVVCRAGALTVSELASVGVGSVLVPLPHAVDDHQTKNAQVLVDADAAVLLPQTQLTPDRLATLFNQLADRERLLTMAKAARNVAKPDACRDVVSVIKQLREKVK